MRCALRVPNAGSASTPIRAFPSRNSIALVDALVAADVRLLEQPLPRGREADLDGFTCPIPVAADESALSLADIPGLVGRFDVVNIKLDKCGGLTEGLEMAHARAANWGCR